METKSSKYKAKMTLYHIGLFAYSARYYTLYCYKNVHIILQKLIRPKTKQGHILTNNICSTVYIIGQ